MGGKKLRKDGLIKAEGVHRKTVTNPLGGGRPSENEKYITEALENGENPNPDGKFIQMRKFEDKLEKVRDDKVAIRGMYSGETAPSEYMNVYNKVSTSKYKGRPWKYPNAEALQEEVTSYFSYMIEHRIPLTPAWLACWLGITTATLKNWQKNQDTMPFYPVIEPALAFIQAMLEGGAVEGRIQAVPFIFLGKNYFGMKDTNELTIYSDDKMTIEDKKELIRNLPKDISD